MQFWWALPCTVDDCSFPRHRLLFPTQHVLLWRPAPDQDLCTHQVEAPDACFGREPFIFPRPRLQLRLPLHGGEVHQHALRYRRYGVERYRQYGIEQYGAGTE